MNQFRPLFYLIVISTFLLASCQKEMNSAPGAGSLNAKSSVQSATLSPQLKARLAMWRQSLPAGSEKRIPKTFFLLQKVDPQFRDMVRRMTNVTPAAACDANTPLTQWLGQQISDWDEDVIYFAVLTGMLDMPMYEALLFENNPNTQTFGVTGNETKIMTKTFKDLKRFWNIQTDGIMTAGMHGNMLLNRDKIIRLDMLLYGDSQPEAEFWADLIVDLVTQIPQYRRGDHPIFTFNSFAQTGFDFPPYGSIPTKIVMGDGMMAGMAGIGYDDVAPQAILAHEYGHQVQFQLNIFSDGTAAGTRRTELMADAFSAYYLSHAKGASMQWKRVRQYLQVFFNIGDCSVTSSDHHGTPTQRLAAADWAYNLATNAQKQGHILTSQDFATLFDANLPQILAH